MTISVNSATDEQLVTLARNITDLALKSGMTFSNLDKYQSKMQVSWLIAVANEFDSYHGQKNLPDSVRVEIIQLFKSLNPKNDIQSDRINSNCNNGVCNIHFALQPIWNYGCWCNFDEGMMTGHGHPVNRYDEICRDFQLCSRCARLDGTKSGESCDPVTKEYTLGSGPNFLAACSQTNGNDDCAAHVCNCEQHLINQLVQLAFQNPIVHVYDPSALHSNGFDHDANCPVPKQPNYAAECCGTYPIRFPYGIENPNKDCCLDESIFNPTFEECCDDGSVADLGNCI